MCRNLVVLFIVAILFCNTNALCPALIRIFNAASPAAPTNIDLIVNGKILVTGVPFSQASRYFGVQPGTLNVLIRQTGTLNTVGLRAFTGVANNAYTVAVTGLLSAPINTLLYPVTPFVFSENLLPANPNKFRGVFHSLSELNQNLSMYITSPSGNNYVPFVQPKTAVAYPEFNSGLISFTLYNATDQLLINSLNITQQLNDTIPTNLIYDLFLSGDDSTINPVQITAITYAPYYDVQSGCTLVDGVLVLPDSTPFVFPTFAPCPVNSAPVKTVFGLTMIICLCLSLLF